MVKLAAFDFDIKHRTGKQHSNADSMSRPPFLRCAQCEIRHQGALETKRPRKVGTVDSSTQTGRLGKLKQTQQKKCGTDKQSVNKQLESKSDGVQTFLHSEKGEKVWIPEWLKSVLRVPSGIREVRQSKARVMTRSQLPQGPKASQGASPSWLEGEVCLDKNVLREEQLKDPASVDAFCWLQSGSRPGKEDPVVWNRHQVLVGEL